MTLDSIAVVGASTAGLAAAGALRRAGFTGHLELIGAEPHRPYDRPPLTKQYLAGDWDADRLGLPGADAPELDAHWRLGVAATALDAPNRTLTLSDGSELTADGIVIATGSVPRTLPGAEAMAGVHMVRTLDDAAALRAEITAGTASGPVVVVGAGFIGAEIAATCRGLGVEVCLVEPLEVPMARALGVEVGTVFAELHRDHGVDLRLGTGVDHLEADATGRVRRVVTTDGAAIDTSTVVVGIGVVPATDWLEGSGLQIDDGVVCDPTCHAAPGVVAAGDVARWPNPVFDDEPMRIEHWDHAMAMGEHAAASLLAGDAAVPFGTVPWFWSDQYDRKLQLAGRIRADDQMVVVDGSLAERRFVALFGRAGRLVGVLGMNRPRHVVQLRARIAEGIGFDEARAGFG